MGIAHYLTTLYIDKAFGHNEAEYKKMTDTREVLKMDADHMAATRIAAEQRAEMEYKEFNDGSGEGVESYTESSRPLWWTGYGHPSELHNPITMKKAGGALLSPSYHWLPSFYSIFMLR
jgi:hypothetical protein